MTTLRRTYITVLAVALTVVPAAQASSQASAGFRSLADVVAGERPGRDAVPAVLTRRVSLEIVNMPLARALDTLAVLTGIGIAYTEALQRAPHVSVRTDSQRVADILIRVLNNTGWSAWIASDGQVVLRSTRGSRDDVAPLAAEQTRISGFVRDAASGEVVRYARITASDGGASQSNADGFYVLSLGVGSHTVRIRALGYLPLDTLVDVSTALTLNIRLSAQTVELAAVVVEAQQQLPDADPASTDMSIARLDLATIRRAPAALGEVDPVRSLTLLPGVSRTSDFSTAFNVRGGSNDQNLILLDEATVYNAAHILGFLSVFNSDAVADVTLFKGAIPARFGGRLSSVLDVRQREGNANAFAGSASVGLLAARASVEGPLKILPGSFLLAARRSYADAFLAAGRDTALRNNKARFYDLNVKGNLRLGTTGSLMLAAYSGRDTFEPNRDFGASWGNASSTLRWNQVFGNRLFSKVSLTSGAFDYDLSFDVLDTKATWTSRVQSDELRIDQRLHLSGAHSVEFGVEFADQVLRPGALVPNDTTKFRMVRVPTREGASAAAYLGHTWEMGTRLSVNYGVRLSQYNRVGAATIYTYANNEPVTFNRILMQYEPGTVTDSTVYAKGRTIRSAGGAEPRLSLRFGLSSNASIKASYARMRQYLLLATRTNTPTPLDVWEPIGPHVDPQLADQLALGYARTTPSRSYEFSAEGYFKRLYNVVDYVSGTDVVLNPQLETTLVQGIGRAYGLELFMRRQTGSVTGWVSYTLGRSEQRFRAAPGAGINNGEWFPSASDKTHDLSIVAMRPLGKRWTMGTTLSAASGLPVTYPVSRYTIDDLILAEYGPRNGSRLPFYHRLDIAFTRATSRGELQLGVFNIYNRFNAQSMSFRQSGRDPLQTEAVQLSIFGIVPSISYTVRF